MADKDRRGVVRALIDRLQADQATDQQALAQALSAKLDTALARRDRLMHEARQTDSGDKIVAAQREYDAAVKRALAEFKRRGGRASDTWPTTRS